METMETEKSNLAQPKLRLHKAVSVNVNQDTLYRLLYSLVLGHTESYAGQTAIKYIGLLFEENEHKGAMLRWEEIKKYLSDNPR